MVKIKVLTFNVASDGDIKKNISEMQNEFEIFIRSKLNDPEDFILFISFQEDTDKPIILNDKFKNELDKNYLLRIESKGIYNFYIHNIIITKIRNININTIKKSLNL